MTLDTTIPDDVAATHRAMWALGDYALVAEEVMAPAGSGPGRPDGYRAGVRVLPRRLRATTSRCPRPDGRRVRRRRR